jgi:hypothetical protein
VAVNVAELEPTKRAMHRPSAIVARRPLRSSSARRRHRA